MTDPLAQFHPLIRQWFQAGFPSVTEVQAEAWPIIGARKHLLATAPTGSGKTLTAFLWSLNRFVTGELSTGTTRILYISPLKALNNDIQRNLLGPLAELRELFAANNTEFPDIDVRTRSGDTEQAERRRMLRHPPEILITTPESLNLLLSSAGGQMMLGAVDTVILDEIHGVISTKRGTWLMSAVERLVPLAGEFQRIALSATVKPLDEVARHVAGYQRISESADEFIERPIDIVGPVAQKSFDITVRFPDDARQAGEDESLWDRLAEDFHRRISANESTLLFVNSRALCEKITWKINTVAGGTIAWAHHGSLSREIRTEVETKLKAGELKAIVATGSLEMGIDIGALDEVILIQAPDAISSAIQRIGRAGHGVGQTSRGVIYPSNARDFIEAAVLAHAICERDIEPVRPVDCPLDVLAQIIVSMTGTAQWDLDQLFVEIRRTTAFRSLSREQFELVVDMLAGRYAAHHIRELNPRINVDRLENTVTARRGALTTLYLSGGVIPDRGYFQLRHEDSNARIGELDEEFVWEARIGQIFSLGTQYWQVRKITHNDVIVAPARASGGAPPFWKAESLSRDFHYASRIGEFLAHANGHLDDPAFRTRLIDGYLVEAPVADEILRFLGNQRRHTGADLPHRHHLVVESIESGPGGTVGHQIVLHTLWGARVNRPFAMALEAGWQNRYGGLPEIYVDNECIVVQLPQKATMDELLYLAPVEQLESLLRQRLEGSGFFAARFRENAGRALLISRTRFNERKPLWMSRLQSQKLMDAVLKFEDFPILLETWRTCLRDEFDLDALKQVLSDIASGASRVTEVTTATPSPFAQSAAWGQVNQYMYMDDRAASNARSNLRAKLLQSVIFEPALRPAVSREVIDAFVALRQRLLPDYLPETSQDLVEWVKERTMIPEAEWSTLVDKALPDGSFPEHGLTILESGAARLIVAREDADLLTRTLSAGEDDDPETSLSTHLGNWLQYYGPLTADVMAAMLGIATERLLPALHRLEEEQQLVAGQLVRNDEQLYWCESGSFETLLRIQRRDNRASFETLPAEALPLFLFHWQAGQRSDDEDCLYRVLEQLRCLSCPAEFRETELLPARLPDYQRYMLDLAFQQGTLVWTGTGEKTVALTFYEDRDLLFETPPECPEPIRQLFPDTGARYDFGPLLDRTGLSAANLTDKLWQGARASVVTNDSFDALRRGIETRFRMPDTPSDRGRRPRRGTFNRWRGSLPGNGNWHRLDYPEAPEDLIASEELSRDRVRVLLDRYGILCSAVYWNGNCPPFAGGTYFAPCA